jgi:hypothetical protein
MDGIGHHMKKSLFFTVEIEEGVARAKKLSRNSIMSKNCISSLTYGFSF